MRQSGGESPPIEVVLADYPVTSLSDRLEPNAQGLLVWRIHLMHNGKSNYSIDLEPVWKFRYIKCRLSITPISPTPFPRTTGTLRSQQGKGEQHTFLSRLAPPRWLRQRTGGTGRGGFGRLGWGQKPNLTAMRRTQAPPLHISKTYRIQQ